MNKLKQLWNNLRSSFWFVPSLILAVSIALAMGLVQAHSIANSQWLARWPYLFGGSAKGSREILSTIAGSMMTVVGVTFSMTLVALVLASSQYTSRILRNFMGDRVTQVVLGVLSGIFAYCLIVLRTIRSGNEGGFVPSLAVFFAMILAMSGIGFLIFFIHHIAASIQASSIIAEVADETITAVDLLFPDKIEHEPMDSQEYQTELPLAGLNWQAVPARRNGYIQSVDNLALLSLARKHKTVVRMEIGVGHFVVQNETLASLTLEGPLEKDIIAALQAVYNIAPHRTVYQDCAFGIRQIVDMALRALSPGINDTTTAVMCLNYLTAILARLASREIPSSHRYEDGELRIIAIGPTFASLVAESFDQIRGSANGNIAIMIQMLDSIQTIASLTASPGRRKVLLEQSQWITELAERTIESPHDKTRFDNRLARARKAFETEPV